MITLTVAAALAIFGLGTWILGTLLGFHEIGMIGACILLGVGVMITGSGLEYQSGEREITTGANETEISYQYDPVETPTQLPLGFLVMLMGGTMVLRTLDDLGGG